MALWSARRWSLKLKNRSKTAARRWERRRLFTISSARSLKVRAAPEADSIATIVSYITGNESAPAARNENQAEKRTMNWIDNLVRPKIRSFLNRREVEDNLWVKCPETGEMVFHRDLEANQWVVPNSGDHMKIKPSDRLQHILDDGESSTNALSSVAAEPLRF